MEAIRYWVEKHRTKVPSRFSSDFICDAISLILENNVFQFDSKHFKQIKGTAMGTKMAPSYANLVLAYLEEKMYQHIRTTKGDEYANFIEQSFLRYLDDCFIIWDDKWDINDFVNILNGLHSNLKFKIEQSKTEIPFLDIKVILCDGKITTDIYFKPTDAHQYLKFNSCHPRHIKHNIPYSQAIRFCTIIDDEHTKKQRLKEMKWFFLARGYPSQLVDQGINKAKSIPQCELRKTRPKENEDVTAFVTTHNPGNPSLWPLVQTTLDVMKTSKRLEKVLNTTKIIKSKRQPPNLKAILTHAKFTTKSIAGGSSKCGDKRCGTCPHIQETFNITITSTGERFRIKQLMNCKNKNVLYIITCNNCRERYVGKTKTMLSKRVNVHRQHIRHESYRQLGLSEHLELCNRKCNIQNMFTIAPFYKLTDNESEALVKEEMFIKRFKAKLNSLSLRK